MHADPHLALDAWFFGTEFVQLIDCVPSANRYETSVMLDARLLGQLLTELSGLHRHGE